MSQFNVITTTSWPDGIFSLITSCLNAESNIETPRDIQRTPSFFGRFFKMKLKTQWAFFGGLRSILRRLTPLFEKKNLVLEVELVDTASWHWLGSAQKNIEHLSTLVGLTLLVKLRFETGQNWCLPVLPWEMHIDPGSQTVTTTCGFLNRSLSFHETVGLQTRLVLL